MKMGAYVYPVLVIKPVMHVMQVSPRCVSLSVQPSSAVLWLLACALHDTAVGGGGCRAALPTPAAVFCIPVPQNKVSTATAP